MSKILPKSWFKFWFVFSAFLLVGIGVYLQIKSISLPTDENFFADLPSRVLNVEKIYGLQLIDGKFVIDSVPQGSLILSIDGISINDSLSLSKSLSLVNNGSILKFYDRDRNLIRNIFIKPQSVSSNKFSFLSSGVIILWVKSGGTSDEAGLRPGDIILAINGQTFSNSRQADNLLINSDPSKPVKYNLLRGNRLITREIKLTTFNITFDSIFRYLVSLVFLFFAIFFVLKHSEAFPLRLLSISFLLLSVIFLSVYYRGGTNLILGKIWLVVVSFALSFSFGFLVHFLLYFPVEQKKLLTRKLVVPLIYVITSLVFLALLLSLTFREATFTSLLTNLSFLPILGYRFILNVLFRKEIIPEQRGLSKKFIVFFIIVVTFIFLFILSLSKLPKFSNLFSLVFYALVGFFPFLLFIVFNKYNFYGISYRIRRNLLYLVSKFALDLTFFVIVLLGLYTFSITTIKFPNLHLSGTRIEVLNRPLSPERNIQYEKIAIVLSSLVFIFILLNIRAKIDKILLRKFHRTKFDYKKTASELSEMIIHNINLPEIARNVASELEKTMLLKKGCLLIYQHEKLCCLDFFKEQNNLLISRLKSDYTTIYNYSQTNEGLTEVNIINEPLGKLLSENQYFYFLPIKHKGNIVGTLLLGEKLSETKYSNEDIEFLEIVSKNIAIAIVNAFLAQELANQERYKQELEIAQKIQLSSLPKDMPNIPGLSISAITIPAFEVGGDFFDFLQNGHNLTIVIGDVSGKGTSAAFYMSKVQGILRTLNEFNLPLKEMLLNTNKLLINNLEKNYFISAFLCQFDTFNSIATMVRAGHLALYFYDGNSKDVRKLVPRGIALGVVPNRRFEQLIEVTSITYSKEDCFVFVTDGVLEHFSENGIASHEKRLIEVIKLNSNLSPKELTEKILTDVCFVDGESAIYDDLTILVVKPN